MTDRRLRTLYPIAPSLGDAPIYRLLGQLSLADLDWNIEQLMTSADARVEHARALQVYRDQRARDLSDAAA